MSREYIYLGEWWGGDDPFMYVYIYIYMYVYIYIYYSDLMI